MKTDLPRSPVEWPACMELDLVVMKVVLGLEKEPESAPAYSTTMLAAFEIVNRMRADGFSFSLFQPS